MGYPEPVPAIKAKNVKDFERRLKNFSLTQEQIERYRKNFQRLKKNKL